MSFKKLVNVVEIVALVAAGAFVLALFVNEPDSGGGGGGAVSPGQAVYEASCASCHGADGGGGIGPQLSDGQVVESYPDVADEVAVVTDGKNGMPGFEGDLSETEIDEVVEYTRSGLGG
jgi:mono/diheme cytochrome c family protein